MKIKFILITCILLQFCINANSQDSIKNTSNHIGVIDSSNKELSIEFKNIHELESLFKKSETSWPIKYGALIIGILAIIGNVITNIFTNSRSRSNTQAQIVANAQNISTQLTETKNNLMAQLENSKNLEKEKRLADISYKHKTELKENVAKFIKHAEVFNKILNEIIHSDLEEGRIIEAEDKYNRTQALRDNLADVYYSIKVALDNSQKQKELESLLNEYMDNTIFKIDLHTLKADEYQQLIPKIYHKIKSILHEGYIEPE